VPKEKSRIVQWEIIGDIGVLTIDNPPGNYLDDPEFVDIRTIEHWTRVPYLKGLIIRGQGRHFSAGADLAKLREMTRRPGIMRRKLERGRRILDHIENLEVPVVAAVTGVCFGGGLEIALSCHMRVAGRQSLFAFPEASLGLIPGLAGTVRLPRRVGEAQSLQLVLSGNTIDAARALELGLVDYVVPPKTVFDFSLDLLRRLTADRPVEVIRNVVRSLGNARRLPARRAMEEETKMFCTLALKEAIKARNGNHNGRKGK